MQANTRSPFLKALPGGASSTTPATSEPSTCIVHWVCVCFRCAVCLLSRLIKGAAWGRLRPPPRLRRLEPSTRSVCTSVCCVSQGQLPAPGVIDPSQQQHDAGTKIASVTPSHPRQRHEPARHDAAARFDVDGVHGRRRDAHQHLATAARRRREVGLDLSLEWVVGRALAGGWRAHEAAGAASEARSVCACVRTARSRTCSTSGGPRARSTAARMLPHVLIGGWRPGGRVKAETSLNVI